MDNLESLIEETASLPVPLAFSRMSDFLLHTHQGKVLAVLGYGSALRDTNVSETLLDIYLLTEDFTGVSADPLSQWACRLVPPNVYYTDMPFEGETIRAKFAVMPLRQFSALMQPQTANPYFWARFCQPCRILYAASDETRQQLVQTLGSAIRTMYANGKSLTNETDPLAIFQAAFEATYRTELRPEREMRARAIVDAGAAYFFEAALLLGKTEPVKGNWLVRRIIGKALSILRLSKAAFTFHGGVDYAAWKIARHSGEQVEITDWNRKHPILTGLIFLPRLLRRGALR